MRFLLSTIFVYLIFFSNEVLGSGLAYPHAAKRIESLNYESRFYVQSNPEILNLLSRYQDTLIKFMVESENVDVFHNGMREFDYRGNLLTLACFYGLKHINFNDFSHPELDPQMISCVYEGKEVDGYLNTFKKNWILSDEERDLYFSEEQEQFIKDAVAFPFELNEDSIQNLIPETLYNFVLLPNGKATAALEKPGNREYHVAGEEVAEMFSYPNHSILAGSAQQEVITAGALISYQMGSKRLYFLSNKSGHYLPKIPSLEHMKGWFEKRGVDPSTVVLLPEVEISKFLIRNFDDVEVSVSMSKRTAKRLFEILQDRWKEKFKAIDRTWLQKIANGDCNCYEDDLSQSLYEFRDEATYMRSGFSLFTAEHKVPEYFHEFVKRFGKLKDAVKHGIPERMQKEALRVLQLMDQYGSRLWDFEIEVCEEESFRNFLTATLQLMDFLTTQEVLPIDDFHQLKKSSRELATLFLLYTLYEERRGGDAYLLYKAKAEEYFQINTLMAEIHDEYVRLQMRGEISVDEAVAQIPEEIAFKVKRNNRQLVLEPAQLHFNLTEEVASHLIEEAMFVWDVAHFNMIVDTRTRGALEQIISQKPANITPYFVEYLNLLRSTAILFLRSYEIFHRDHKPSENIKWYIHQIDRILRQVPHRKTETLLIEVDQLEPFRRALLPSDLINDFYMADSESLNKAYQKYLKAIQLISENDELTIGELVHVYENAERLAALFELLKRSRVVEREHPLVVYETLSRLVNAFVVEVKAVIQENSDSFDKELIDVNSAMDVLAKRIFEKLQ